jgi:hypothetical protein
LNVIPLFPTHYSPLTFCPSFDLATNLSLFQLDFQTARRLRTYKRPARRKTAWNPQTNAIITGRMEPMRDGGFPDAGKMEKKTGTNRWPHPPGEPC